MRLLSKLIGGPKGFNLSPNFHIRKCSVNNAKVVPRVVMVGCIGEGLVGHGSLYLCFELVLACHVINVPSPIPQRKSDSEKARAKLGILDPERSGYLKRSCRVPRSHTLTEVSFTCDDNKE